MTRQQADIEGCVDGYLVQVLHTTCTWYQVLVAPGIYGRRASVQVLMGTWYKGTVYIRYSYSTTEIVHVCVCILRTTSTGGVYSVWYSYSGYVVLGVQYCLRSMLCPDESFMVPYWSTSSRNDLVLPVLVLA
jgi:hypothetical protein